MKTVELLAPSGNEEALFAAINNGADAVYLGLSSFNARIKADNFNMDNIRKITHFAHLFGVKVYITVNTIIKNNEVNEFLNMIDECVNAKVDAFIIQDYGVAYLLKNRYKDIVMHASTQLGIHNLSGALVAQKLGFKRIILSRETTLEDIKNIKQNTDLEIEYFIQGALCVSFSGNCYMSSLISGLSGNRGKCQQYCRKKYAAMLNGEFISKEYHLSTKDLCLVKRLRDLVDAGVCSFKIEGRLRHAGYVSVATAIYRKIIDQNFAYSEDDILELRNAFSRGDFNYNAYLENQKGGIINSKNQNHVGTKIGKLKSFRPFKNDLYELEIETTHQLTSGDGLKLCNGEKEVMSLGVGNVIKKPGNIYKVFTKNRPIMTGLDVYLTLDAQKENIYLNRKRKLKIKATITCLVNKPLSLVLEYKNIKARVFSNSILAEALTQPISNEDIINQLKKTNDTNFEIVNIDIKKDNVFIAKSVLNEVRRKALEKLEELIVEDYESNITAIKNNNYELDLNVEPFKLFNKAIIIDETINYKEISNDFNGLIIYASNNYKNINNKFLELKEYFKKAEFALNLPVILPSIDEKVINEIVTNLDNNIYLIANNIYGLNYIFTHPLIGGLGLNINNDFAIKSLSDLGVKSIILSLETNINFAKLHEDTFIYDIGYNVMMNFTHCPFIHLTGKNCASCQYSSSLEYKDEFNKSFAIRRIRINSCHFELINYRPINVYKKNNNQVLIDLRHFKNIDFINQIITKEETIKLDNEYSGLLFKSID